jgi:crotonobetainyl-CoA:carnitine CoA-transferase CaiB-like acyl-CoA transferase
LAPHGVYPAAGVDRWVAIACQSDAAWGSLCEVMGLDHLAADRALATAQRRQAESDALDREIANWTRSRDECQIESLLIDAGVAAHVVQNSAECVRDPQLQHRGHFTRVSHAVHGEVCVEGSRFKLSRTPALIERGAPELGEHNGFVLQEILGYDADRVSDLIAGGALG